MKSDQTVTRMETKLQVVKNQREQLSDLLADEAVAHGETRRVLEALKQATTPQQSKGCPTCGGTVEIAGVPGLHSPAGCAWIDAHVRLGELTGD